MAGRIPQNFIDDLLDRVDIVETIDRRVPLKKSGKNFSACCPFHDEKTPSFSVNQEKQFYYCFGCGAGGNALGFLMDYERLDFPRAVETLADACGLEVPREASAFQEPPQQKRNIYTLLEKSADFYRQQLYEHPDRQRAVDYLKSRGLSGEIARDFDIGFAVPGWDNLLKELGQKDEEKQLLIDGGMLIDREEDNKLYDRFRDRIIFPIRDSRGRVIAFGGRVFGDDKPKYLNSPETPVFHKNRELYGLYQARKANRQLHRLIIVEGYMDVVALAQHGINYAVATLGTATSTEHLRRVFRHCPEVVFCFDGDAAGRKAASRALESALPVMEDGRQARFLFLPQGEDPDSMVRQVGAGEFTRLIDAAQPLENYLFNSQSEQLNLDTLEGKARLSTLAAPLIALLPEGVFKALMLSSLAQRTGLSEDRLATVLDKHQKELQQQQERASRREAERAGGAPLSQAQGNTAPPKRQTTGQEPTAAIPGTEPRRRQHNEQQAAINRDPLRYAIALLLLQPRIASHCQLPGHLAAADNPDAQLLTAMFQLLQKRPDSTSAMLLGHWYGDPQGEALKELLQMDHLIPEEGIEQEFRDTLSHLDQRQLQSYLDRQLGQLDLSDFSRLSPEDKEQLKQLLADKNSK